MSGYKRIFKVPVGKTKEDAMKSLQELIMQYRDYDTSEEVRKLREKKLKRIYGRL